MKITLVSMALGFFLTLAGAAIAHAAPTPAAKPADMPKVATCNDGKAYHHRTGEKRGACSGHQGVKEWADGSPVKSGGKNTSYR